MIQTVLDEARKRGMRRKEGQGGRRDEENEKNEKVVKENEK